jgi:hypothetical protein
MMMMMFATAAPGWLWQASSQPGKGDGRLPLSLGAEEPAGSSSPRRRRRPGVLDWGGMCEAELVPRRAVEAAETWKELVSYLGRSGKPVGSFVSLTPNLFVEKRDFEFESFDFPARRALLQRATSLSWPSNRSARRFS